MNFGMVENITTLDGYCKKIFHEGVIKERGIYRKIHTDYASDS